MIPPTFLRSLPPALLLFVCAAANAQPVETAKPSARVTYQRALDAADRNDWAEARRLYLEIWKETETYDTAAGLGLAEFKLGRRAAGARYMALALKMIPITEKPETRRRLEAMFAEMKPTVAAVHVSVSKDGAEVRVDGEAIGRSPLSADVYLDPGPHTLAAELGQERGSTKLDVVAGQSYEASLSLNAPPVGESTPSEMSDARAVSNHSDGSGRANWAPVLITGGLALVAAGFGVGFTLDASSAKSDGDKARSRASDQFGAVNPCDPQTGGSSDVCRELRDLQDRRQHSNNAATVSWVLSGVFAAAAVGSYFVWGKPKKEASPTASVGAWVGLGVSGVRVQGSF